MEFRFNRRFLLTVGLIILSLTSWAQTFPLQIQVSVMPPYSAYLQDYPGAGQQVRVFIINSSRNTYQIRLAGQLIGDNGIEIRTSPNYRPPRPLTVPPGQTLLTRNALEGLFDLNQIDVTGIDKNLLARGFPLPDGTYQLCVRAYNETATNTAAVAFGQALSPEFPLGCSAPIIIKSVEPPILISPLCDAEVTATNPQAVVFTWTPPAGVSPASVEYVLRVVELPQADVDPNVFIDAVALPKSGVDVRGLRTSTFLYGPTQPPLIVGKRYAWRVQAIDRSRKLNFLNDGKAPVCAFTYGTGLPIVAKKPGLELVQTPTTLLPVPGLFPAIDTPPAGATAMMYKSGSIPAICSCKQEPTDSTVDNSKALAQKSATISGGFPLTFLLDVKEDPDKHTLSGTAMVPMPIVNSSYANVRCRLVDVQCNAAGEVISGYVQAIQTNKPGPWPTYTKPKLTPDPLSSDQISQLGQYWTTYQEGVVSQANNAKQSAGWEVPFGIQKSIGGFGGVFTVTDLTFTPGDAYFNANMWISVPEVVQFKGIPLSASHVCIKWNGTGAETCGDKVLYLADTVNIGAGSQLRLSLKGSSDGKGNPDTTNATYVRYNDKGFERLHVVAGLTSPALKKASDKSPLEMLTRFDVYDPNFTNWTAQFSTPDDFYVVGLNNFVFSLKDADGKIQPATYDHDDTHNPGEMPANYDPGKDVSWHGLYMPEVSLSLPFLKALNNGNDVPVGVHNMILDANGFTGRAYAGSLSPYKPIVTLGKGSLGGWYCSTDQLSLTFVQSSLISCELDGQVVLPIFKYQSGDGSQQSSVWPWKSTYSTSGDSLQFVISPKDSAYVDLWKARLTIQKEGYKLKTLKNGLPNVTAITATYKEAGFNAKAVLNMNLSLSTGIIIAPNMSVEGLAFQTNPPPGEDVFDPGAFNAGLNSPQRYIGGDDENSGLPLELTQVTAGKAASLQSGEYDINLTGVLNLTKISSLTAGGTGYVRFWVGNDATGRPDWHYVTTGLTSASVNGTLGPITLNGELNLFGYAGAEHPVYGKGVSTSLTVSVLGADFGGATLEGWFGSKKDDKAQGRFRYWQVGGYVDLGMPGVPIAPAINLRKFGGGAFNNMVMTVDTNSIGEPTGGISFKPQRGGCGFQAAVGITTADGNALGLTGRLTVGFNDCDGDLSLNNVTVDVTAQLLVGDSPLAKGRGLLNVLFKNNKPDVIDGNAKLTANYSVGGFYATGGGDFGFHVDMNNKDNFYVYLGKPAQRASVTFGVTGVGGLDFNTYFFMGNPQLVGIDQIPPLPYGIPDGVLNSLHYAGSKAFNADNVKKAFAFGAGLQIKIDDSFGPFYLDFSGSIGYDLVLQNGLSCAGDPANGVASYTPGINGWYANGQIYAYLGLELGIDVDLWFYSGRLQALKITAAALMEGGMVNPVWLHGSALLKYRVLGGRIKGSVQAEFWYNKNLRCVTTMQQPNPFADMPIVSVLLPTSKDPVNTITPFYAEFNYPVKALIEVNDVDQQGNTLDKFRTFRLDFMGDPNNPFKLVAKNGIDPKYAVCSNTTSGRLQMNQSADGDFNESNYSATFYRDAAMAPHTSYSLTIGVQVYIKESDCVTNPVSNCSPNRINGWAEYMFASKDAKGNLDKPKSVNELKTVEFTTGDCNGTLTQTGSHPNVAYSFPFEGQRYFTIDDAQQGFVELTAMSCCNDDIKSDDKFDLSVRMVPLNGTFNQNNALMAANVNFDNRRIYYDMPMGIKRQQLYRLDVVRIPNDNYVKAQMAELTKQKAAAISKASNKPATSSTKPNPTGYASAKPGAGLGNTALAINEKANTFYSNTLNASSMSLQTGPATLGGTVLGMTDLNATDNIKVNVTLEQQAASVKQKYEQVLYSYYFQTSRYGTLADKLKTITVLTNEQQTTDYYTIFPIKGQEGFDTYELDWKEAGNGKIRPPLVLMETNGNTNPWQKDYVLPMVGLINSISNATKSNKQKLFTDKGFGNQQYARPGADYKQLMRSVMAFINLYDNAQPPITPAEVTSLTTK